MARNQILSRGIFLEIISKTWFKFLLPSESCWDMNYVKSALSSLLSKKCLTFLRWDHIEVFVNLPRPSLNNLLVFITTSSSSTFPSLLCWSLAVVYFSGWYSGGGGICGSRRETGSSFTKSSEPISTWPTTFWGELVTPAVDHCHRSFD
jgi:hypothetical protein